MQEVGVHGWGRGSVSEGESWLTFLLHLVRRVNSCGRSRKLPTSPMPAACPSASDFTTFPARGGRCLPTPLNPASGS